jgi:hypothetical protein
MQQAGNGKKERLEKRQKKMYAEWWNLAKQSKETRNVLVEKTDHNWGLKRMILLIKELMR